MELNAILTPLGAFGPMIGGVLLLLIVVKLLSMPITVIKALIAGFFGVPGALAVVLYELLVK